MNVLQYPDLSQMPLMTSNNASIGGNGQLGQESGSPINLAHFPYQMIKQEGGGMMSDSIGNGGYLSTISSLSLQHHHLQQTPLQGGPSKKEKSKKSVDNTTKKKKTR